MAAGSRVWNLAQAAAGAPTALQGLRVLDFSRVLAGPWCTQLLADLGADVVKVEAPGGDDTRTWGPPWTPASPSHRAGAPRDAAYYHCANRNKRSIVLDLKSAQGMQHARALAKRADVVVENFKTGTMERFGLGYQELSAKNPGLVYGSITGFGHSGPRAKEPGYDFMIQAASGMMHVTGSPDAPPSKVGIALCDLFTGLYLSTGILAALRARDTTGRGQMVEVSLFECAVACMSNQATSYLIGGMNPQRVGNHHPSIAPYDLLHGSDAPFVATVGNSLQWHAFCRVLGVSDIADDERFACNSARVSNRSELMAVLEPVLCSRPAGEWVQALHQAGVPCSMVNDLRAVFDDPQAKARGLVVDVDGLKTVACPIHLSATPVQYRRAAPGLGQDMEEVLGGVGDPSPSY